ncbi:MAG: TolC family protein [Magnetococcales bacterium]|nr:TolC family protein [Magnetococcales bacterium]
MKKGFSALWAVMIFGSLGLATPGESADLPTALESVLQSHPRLQAVERDLDANAAKVDSARSGWFPNLNVTAYKGGENIRRPAAPDTSLDTTSVTFKATQLVYDFGEVNATIDSSQAKHEQTRLNLEAMRQDMILEAITAYLNQQRSKMVLDYAIDSESNIKKQTELENIRVSQGAGVSTDVLQAKAQLAGANARRIQAEEAYANSSSRVKAVFADEAAALPKVKVPNPTSYLPKSLPELLDYAMNNNPHLQSTQMGVKVAEFETDRVFASEFMPKIQAVADVKHKDDDGGTVGKRDESLVTLQFTQNLNMGMRGLHETKAFRKNKEAAAQRLDESRRQIQENGTNSWTRLEAAKMRAVHLREQARLAEEFLRLARKERELGRRTLLDVLQGETSLINANSDASAAEMDAVIASYMTLHAMGKLDMAQIRALHWGK